MKRSKPQRGWKQYEIDYLMRSYVLLVPFSEVAIYLDRTYKSVESFFTANKRTYIDNYDLIKVHKI